MAHLGLWSAYTARTRPVKGRWLPAAVAFAVTIGVWWLVTASGMVEPLYLPNPIDVVARMIDQAGLGIAWRYLSPTIAAALLGTAIAVAVALPLGILVTHSRLLAAVVEPLVAITQTVPMVAIAPLLVLWIGYGTVPIAVLCAIMAFFPMVTTTVVGLRNLDMRVVENALLDGTSSWQRLVHIEGPMAAPSSAYLPVVTALASIAPLHGRATISQRYITCPMVSPMDVRPQRETKSCALVRSRNASP